MNEVLMNNNLIRLFLLFLFMIELVKSEYTIKMTHHVPTYDEQKDFFNKLDKHRIMTNKKKSFLKHDIEIEESRFKAQESLSMEAEMEMEKKFGKVLMSLTNFKNSQYIADLRLGEPAQIHKVMFDTGSSNFWVTSSKCKSPGCIIHKGYNGEKSIYHQNLNKTTKVTFGSGSIYGTYARDKVEFGPITLYDQEFGMIEKQVGDIFTTLKFSGILGLSFPALSTNNYVPFFDNIINNNLLKKNMFAMYLTTAKEKVDAQMILGEPSKEFYKGNITWVNVVEKRYWAVKMDDVYIDNKPLNMCGKDGCKLIVDSGTSVITAPNKHFEVLMKEMKLDDCKKNYKNLPKLSFKIEGKMFSVGPEQYIYKTNDYDNETPDCRDGFMALDIAAPRGPLWILGDIFMRKYLVIYDRDTKRVGFAIRKENVVSKVKNEVTIVPGRKK